MENPEQEIEQQARISVPEAKRNLENMKRLIDRAHRSGMDVTKMRAQYEELRSNVQKMENEWLKSR